MVRIFYIISFLVCLVAGILIFVEPLFAIALVLTAYAGAKSIDGMDKN